MAVYAANQNYALLSPFRLTDIASLSKRTCARFVRSGPPFLTQLLAHHNALQAGDATDTTGLFGRCNGQQELDEMMRYCWEPAIGEARRRNESVPGAAHVEKSRISHSWSKVIHRLESLRRNNAGGLFKQYAAT